MRRASGSRLGHTHQHNHTKTTPTYSKRKKCESIRALILVLGWCVFLSSALTPTNQSFGVCKVNLATLKVATNSQTDVTSFHAGGGQWAMCPGMRHTAYCVICLPPVTRNTFSEPSSLNLRGARSLATICTQYARYTHSA